MGNRQSLGGNDYWRVSWDAQEQVMVLERTPLPFPDLHAIGPAQDHITRIVGGQVKAGRARVLLDFRQGPIGNNDPKFEQASEAARHSLSQLFTKVAVLVRTQAGKLQVSRLQKSEPNVTSRAVFTEEAEAWRWLLG
jgi:hypothetical protein